MEKLKNLLGYLGDAAHRRAVVGAALLIGNHLFGWSHDPDVIASIDVVLGFALAAWSSSTPRLEDVA